MTAMMDVGDALDALVSRGDRDVLIAWYDEAVGGGGGGRAAAQSAAPHRAQAPWLFWPGGWHGGAGWRVDAEVAYSLEAATLRDEVAAEAQLVEEGDAALAAAVEHARRTKQWHENLQASRRPLYSFSLSLSRRFFVCVCVVGVCWRVFFSQCVCLVVVVVVRRSSGAQ